MHWIFLALFWTAALPAPLKNQASTAISGNVVTWLTETEHDFGPVRAGSTVRYTFKFQNARSEPIVLQTVRTTCGCTAAEWTETPLAPGENGEILIEFDADHEGSFRKKITVFFDKQRKAEVLWIMGVVI